MFMRSPADWVAAALSDGFNAIEILCEGPQWPRSADTKRIRENMSGKNIEIYMHSPTIDLNPASVNRGIREETLRQLKEAADMAAEIGASFVTTHPGIVHKEKVRGYCAEFAKEILGEASDYTKSAGSMLSIENMPVSRQYFCNTGQELDEFRNACDCGITIDVGHAVLCERPYEFLEMPGISYLHVNDNRGTKDEHLCPGEGILDLRRLAGQPRMILELDDYSKVIRGKNAVLKAIHAE